ncbi:hypothetical protein LOC51_14350 [Rubrivivax sp. JA1024]|nr:hypothetical protein [Rubrivivax sp. JA1024]
MRGAEQVAGRRAQDADGGREQAVGVGDDDRELRAGDGQRHRRRMGRPQRRAGAVAQQEEVLRRPRSEPSAATMSA